MSHEILDHVRQILREESGFEPLNEERLDQLFEENRDGFARAIARIEFGLDQRLCNDRYIQAIRVRTVEFMLWVLSQRFESDDPFLMPGYDDGDCVEERVEELVDLAIADELAAGKYDHDQHQHDVLYSKVNQRGLRDVYVESMVRWREFSKQQTS